MNPCASSAHRRVNIAVRDNSRWYTDPTFHLLDRDAIFERSWQGIGREAQLREPGMYSPR